MKYANILEEKTFSPRNLFFQNSIVPRNLFCENSIVPRNLFYGKIDKKATHIAVSR